MPAFPDSRTAKIFSTSGRRGVNRWGDYFGGAVDPVSGGLWTSGQYAETRHPNIPTGFRRPMGNLGGILSVADGFFFTDVPSSSVYYDYVNVLSLWRITTGCTATTFCPTDLVQRAQLAVFIIRSMLAIPARTIRPVPRASPIRPLLISRMCRPPMPASPTSRRCATWGSLPAAPPRHFVLTTGSAMARRPSSWSARKLKSVSGDNFGAPSTASFADVPSKPLAYPYVQKMFELGITSGCSTDTFCPDRTYDPAAGRRFRGSLFLKLRSKVEF